METDQEFMGWAFFVGVREYKDNNIRSVPAVAQDIEKLDELLQERGYKDRIRTITENATREYILEQLEDFKAEINEELDAQDENSVLFIFAGHGHLYQEKYYFLTEKTEFLESGAVNLDTCIPDWMLLQKVLEIPATKMTIIFNTCFADGVETDDALSLEELGIINYNIEGLDLTPVPYPRVKKIINNIKTQPPSSLQEPERTTPTFPASLAVVTSSEKKQKSWIRRGADHSLFGTFLLEAFQRREVYVAGVFDYIARKLSFELLIDPETRERVKQTPRVRGDWENYLLALPFPETYLEQKTIVLQNPSSWLKDQQKLPYIPNHEDFDQWVTIDPRILVDIDEKLLKVDNQVLVTSEGGGRGKSTYALAIAYILDKKSGYTRLKKQFYDLQRGYFNVNYFTFKDFTQVSIKVLNQVKTSSIRDEYAVEKVLQRLIEDIVLLNELQEKNLVIIDDWHLIPTPSSYLNGLISKLRKKKLKNIKLWIITRPLIPREIEEFPILDALFKTNQLVLPFLNLSEVLIENYCKSFNLELGKQDIILKKIQKLTEKNLLLTHVVMDLWKSVSTNTGEKEYPEFEEARIIKHAGTILKGVFQQAYYRGVSGEGFQSIREPPTHFWHFLASLALVQMRFDSVPSERLQNEYYEKLCALHQSRILTFIEQGVQFPHSNLARIWFYYTYMFEQRLGIHDKIQSWINQLGNEEKEFMNSLKEEDQIFLYTIMEIAGKKQVKSFFDNDLLQNLRSFWSPTIIEFNTEGNIIGLSLSWLRKFPETLCNLSYLKRLSLSYNQFKQLSSRVSQLTSLQTLILENNLISDLPKSLGNLKNLKNLELTHNQFEKLPKTISGLDSLQTLIIDNNRKIKGFPNALGELKSLKTLIIRNNQNLLRGEPQDSLECICSLDTLEELFLENNPLINSLPYSIGKLISLKTLELSHNNLLTLPESIGMLINLEKLNINEFQLQGIPNSIGNLRSLKYLQIKNSRLKKIPESISQVISLKTLELSYNSLNEIPLRLGELHSLEILNLRSNSLKKIPKSLGHLHNLRLLYLSSNRLKRLPDSIRELKKLKLMDLSSNHFMEINDSIFELQSLHTLNLSSNPLKDIPENIGRLTSLHTLLLRSNELKTLPDSISNLKKLKKLDLSINKLEEIPDSISQLENLQDISLRNNSIKKFPKSLINLKSLKNLDLSSNGLKEIPNVSCQIPSLRKLYFKYNQLQAVPESIKNLSSLEELELSSNRFKNFPEAMCQVHSLQKLILNYNEIPAIPDAIESLLSLQYLGLRSNKINELPRTFDKLESLKELNISKNDFKIFPQVILNLPILQKLDIGENEIKIIPEEISKLRFLKYIGLQWVPLIEMPEALIRDSRHVQIRYDRKILRNSSQQVG